MIERQLPDGTPYEIIEAGDPPRPVHDADVCGQCQFVAHPDFIGASHEQVGQVLMTFGRLFKMKLGLFNPESTIVPLGLFTLPGWNGHNTFWLFQCPSCDAVCKDYLHGWRLYLKCGECGEHLSVEGERFYAAAGQPKPPTRWQTLMHMRRARRELTNRELTR